MQEQRMGFFYQDKDVSIWKKSQGSFIKPSLGVAALEMPKLARIIAKLSEAQMWGGYRPDSALSLML